MRASIAAGLSALLLLTACGGGSDPAAAPAPEGTDTAARTVETQFGPVTVEGAPARIVAGNYESDIALALGVKPVVMGQWLEVPDGSPPWRRPLLEAAGGDFPITFPYNPDGYDVEQTLAENPDLILDSFLLENEWSALQAAVPTVSLGYDIDTREFTRRIGAALGLEAEAEELVAQTDAEIEAAAAEYPQFAGSTIAYGYALDDGTIMDYSDPTTLSFLTQLGFVASPALEPIEDFSALGPEQFQLFDADVTVVTYSTPELQAQIEGNPLFQQIPAVAEGRYWGITDPDQSELLRSFSPAQISYAIENFLPELATNTAGG